MGITFKTTDRSAQNLTTNNYPIPWSMTRAEQAVLIQLLRVTKPKVAIEIGTYNGGSLQVISEFSEKVYALDLEASFKDKRCENLPNVTYLIGNSQSILPQLVDKINKSDEVVEFVLIDGDHSAKGVLEDINNVLKLIPKSAITVILHDSFNPDCRSGMKAYDYNTNPYVKYVELDYVTGAFNHDNLYREMWGGFGCIEMSPQMRTKPIKIEEYQKQLYKITYYKSIHFYRKFFWFLKPIYKVFKKTFR